MKLRTKLTLFSILLIVLAVAACCILTLRFAQERAIDDLTTAALRDMKRFCTSFFYNNDSRVGSDAVQRSYAISKFYSISGAQEYTLRQDGEYLCNNLGFDAEACFDTAADYHTRYRTVRVDGTAYFIAMRKARLFSREYSICLVRDISELSQSIGALAVKCVAAALIVLAMAALLTWLVVDRSMKPVEKLKAGAARLANGHYENRIAIAGRNELSELAADFNGMADAIETTIGEINEKSERQQTFINDLSHELKTPITSILLCSETLLNRKVPPETRNRSLERIYDQGKWLEALSQKLMTLVLLQGEITMRTESVPALLDAVRAATIDALHTQGMELITDCGMDVLPMDFDLLRAALTNLVENARKASGDGQAIEIHAHGQTIAVIDHGRGIPKEEIARITEPFYMVDRSRSKRSGGSGLGLALVKRIAEAHGAALSIASILEQGTTVRLTFPSAK